MNLFRLDASILPARSASAALGDLVQREWLAARPGNSVTRRDIGTDPVAATLWPELILARSRSGDTRTTADRHAARQARVLADELLAADALLFDVPLYNFGVSQHFKSWFDVVYTVAETGTGGTGLAGKPAVLVSTLGGNYSPGTPREGWDHSTPWLRRVLAEVWRLDLHLVYRPFTLVGVDPALERFAEMADGLRTTAESDARAAGRAIAGAAAERTDADIAAHRIRERSVADG